MNRLAVLMVIVLTLLIPQAFAGGGGEAAQLPLPEGFSSESGRGITLQWKVEGENLNVRVAAATTGWIAVGFDPSRGMKDANIIIGYVEDGRAFVRDDFGTGRTAHSPDEELGGSSNVRNAEGAEENGQTWLSFTIPLDSGDQYDRPLEPGNRYEVILAAGNRDDFATYHGNSRTSVTIEL